MKFVPGFYERSSAFVLELRGQSVAVDSGLGELGQNRFAIPPIGRYRRTEFAVIGKGFQRTLWHRVNRKWCDQLLDVEDVGGFGIFGSSAGKQESLWAAAANRFPDGELAPPAHEQERRFAVFLKPGNLCVVQINFRRAPCSLNADFR